MFYRSLALIFAAFASADAATLANITLAGIPPVSEPGCCIFHQDFADFFVLDVEGGTGTGTALLDVTLYTTVQESYTNVYRYYTDAAVNGSLAPYGPNCNMGPQCDPQISIPFTFGQPQLIVLSGYVDARLNAEYGTDLGALEPWAPYIGASVVFGGVSRVLGPTNEPVSGATAMVTTVPEPGTGAIVITGLMLVLFGVVVPVAGIGRSRRDTTIRSRKYIVAVRHIDSTRENPCQHPVQVRVRRAWSIGTGLSSGADTVPAAMFKVGEIINLLEHPEEIRRSKVF